MRMPAYEVNFDGLVGPTHNYAGLSYGNIASTEHKLSISSPREAALQGLSKMKFLHDLGLKQAVLLPQERPHIPTLRKIGFDGSDARILEQVFREDPMLLAAVCSSSTMWAANAATVSPSADTQDHRVHFTPANLITQFHRSIEPPMTTRILRAIFHDETAFVVHDPLPAAAHFSDEGAANHTRLCSTYGEPGVEIFVYGRRAFNPSEPGPAKFPARQTLEACAAIARNHKLRPDRVLFLRQNPAAIDAGAFHNDVVAVSNQYMTLLHELAYAEPAAPLNISLAFGHEKEMNNCATFPIQDAVTSYVFNSQLVTRPDGKMALIAPVECRDHPAVQAYIDEIIDGDPISAVHYVDVRQSMQNGGGPACLRLRVVLNDQELAKVHPGVMFTDELHQALAQWIHKHYREHRELNDLRDPALLIESRAALNDLCSILRLPALYDFQLQ